MSNRVAAFLALLIFSDAGNAHDLFVTTQTAASDKTHAVTGVIRNGTFHESAGAFPRERVRDSALHEGGRKSQPNLDSWKVVGTESRFTLRPAVHGTFLVGVSTMASSSTRTAAEFADYLKLEDLPDVLATYDAARYPAGVTYAYSKHARAIGQVGKALTDDYAASSGFPLEIKLQRHPSKMKVGERATFQVLHRGLPAPGLRVYVGSDAHAPPADGHDTATLVRTDASGKGSFVATRRGTWYIHTNRMVRSTEKGTDFISDRASLTFQVGTPGMR